jgi:hypothetical protein
MKRILMICILFAIMSYAQEVKVKTAVLPQLMSPEAVQANSENLYITDGFSIKIISLKNFQLKKTFGRRGEGPQEFKGYILAYVFPEYVFVNNPGKVSYFTLDGNFIKEIRTTHIFGRFKPLGNEHFVGYSYSRKDKIRYESIYIFDSNFNKVKEIYKRKHFLEKNGAINLIEERPPFFCVADDKVFLDGVDGVIYVYDKTGKQVGAVRHDYERIAFTAVHKKRFVDFLKKNNSTREYYGANRERFTYPDYFPPIRMFHVSSGNIYVMTNKETAGKNEFIIFDMNGKVLKKLFIPVAPFEESMIPLFYTIDNGKLYHLVDNEETEEWEVRIYPLNINDE